MPSRPGAAAVLLAVLAVALAGCSQPGEPAKDGEGQAAPQVVHWRVDLGVGTGQERSVLFGSAMRTVDVGLWLNRTAPDATSSGTVARLQVGTRTFECHGDTLAAARTGSTLCRRQEPVHAPREGAWLVVNGTARGLRVEARLLLIPV